MKGFARRNKKAGTNRPCGFYPGGWRKTELFHTQQDTIFTRKGARIKRVKGDAPLFTLCYLVD